MIIGLDGEMSSPDRHGGGVLIQAGAAAWQSPDHVDVFRSLLRVDTPHSQWLTDPLPASHARGTHRTRHWDREAQAVHGITREQVDAASPASEVDDALRQWLLAHGAVEGRRLLVATGFNVGGFDLPFFADALPASMALVSRRSVDLNACCSLLDGWDPNPRITTPRDGWAWKRAAKTIAGSRLPDLGVTGHAHDAGYDAAEALVAFRFLRDQLQAARAGATSGTATPRAARAWLFARIETALDRSGVTDRATWWTTPAPQLGGRTPLAVTTDSDPNAHDWDEMLMRLARGASPS